MVCKMTIESTTTWTVAICRVGSLQQYWRRLSVKSVLDRLQRTNWIKSSECCADVALTKALNQGVSQSAMRLCGLCLRVKLGRAEKQRQNLMRQELCI